MTDSILAADRRRSASFMTMPEATRRQPLRRDLVEQRLLVAFADQFGVSLY
jgi:hypothetical protein